MDHVRKEGTSGKICVFHGKIWRHKRKEMRKKGSVSHTHAFTSPGLHELPVLSVRGSKLSR